MAEEKIFKQGAEAKLYISDYEGKRCLVKERFQKNYRHPILDTQLTKERIRAEVKAINRCQHIIGVKTPACYGSDEKERKIYLEYLDTAITAKHFLNTIVPTLEPEDQEKEINGFGSQLGRVVGKLHANNIVHGDLTTSNVLLVPKGCGQNSFEDYDLYMIDFGLSQYQSSAETKGVDLYVLERAILSTHNSMPTLFPAILAAYSEENSKSSASVVVKFEEVRARGRKRTMIG